MLENVNPFIQSYANYLNAGNVLRALRLASWSSNWYTIYRLKRWWGSTPPKVRNLAQPGTYKVGLWSLCHMSWPAVKSAIIMAESVVEPGCDGGGSVTSSSNPDVYVCVGSTKVTVIMVTLLVTQMWHHPPCQIHAMGAVRNLPFQLDDGLCNLCNCLCESGLLWKILALKKPAKGGLADST